MGSGYTRVPFGLVVRPRVPIERFRVQALLSAHLLLTSTEDINGCFPQVIIRTSTSIASRGVVHTDSNGRDMLARTRDARPSWPLNTSWGFNEAAGNYYPLAAAAVVGGPSWALAV
eukprot:5246459-Pyramimonas_sp.AAC.1